MVNPVTRTRLCVMTSPREIHALLEAAFNAGDIDAFVDAFEDDASMIVPPEGERVSGKPAIRAALEPTFAMNPIASIVVTGELEADGLALTHARLDVVAGDLEVSGRGTIVSRRQPDGTWLWVIDQPRIAR